MTAVHRWVVVWMACFTVAVVVLLVTAHQSQLVIAAAPTLGQCDDPKEYPKKECYDTKDCVSYSGCWGQSFKCSGDVCKGGTGKDTCTARIRVQNLQRGKCSKDNKDKNCNECALFYCAEVAWYDYKDTKTGDCMDFRCMTIAAAQNYCDPRK